MFDRLKSSLKGRVQGVVEDIKGRRAGAADPYMPTVAAPVVARPVVAPVAAPRVAAPPEAPVAVSPPPILAPVVEAPVAAPTPPILHTPVAPSMASAAAAAAAGTSSARMLHADTGSTDLDAYMARAKANGRAASSVSGGIGVNVAEDGEAFWGPVDNESSRAKAAGKVLTVDQWECISCGTCVEQTDKVYYLPADGKATPIAQDGPMDLIQDAIDACPVTCIHWVPPAEAEERGLATGIAPAQ